MSKSPKQVRFGSRELYAIGLSSTVVGLLLVCLGLYLVSAFPNGLRWFFVGLVFVGLVISGIGLLTIFVGITLSLLKATTLLDPETVKLIIFVTLIVSTIASAAVLAYFNIISSSEFIELVKYVIVAVISALTGYGLGRKVQ